MNTDIILSGVGGQGILSIATIIGAAAIKEGLYIKQAEVHGMSQRGGSVVTYVRAGDVVFSPIIEPGEADYILSFEKLEALRYAKYLRRGGVIVTGEREIDPMSVTCGNAEYPADIIGELRRAGIEVDSIDATAIAEAAGSAKAENVALIGRLSLRLGIPEERWLEAVKASVPAKMYDINCAAFKGGRGE